MPVGCQRRRALSQLLLLSLLGFTGGMLTAVRRSGAPSIRFLEGRSAVGVIHDHHPHAPRMRTQGARAKGLDDGESR